MAGSQGQSVKGIPHKLFLDMGSFKKALTASFGTAVVDLHV